MRKYVNGKLYDTERATMVCDFWNGLAEFDFAWEQKTLYKTKKGNYFFFVEGGPASQYAEYRGNAAYFGKDIIVPSNYEVKEFVGNFGSEEQNEMIGNYDD